MSLEETRGEKNFWLEGCDPAVLRKSAETIECKGLVLRSLFKEHEEEKKSERLGPLPPTFL